MKKSDSHWYARYVGDYMKKTQDLSLMQHGAYTVLMDYYYSTNQPLPANADSLHRICRAFVADERAAMQVILDRFFVQKGEFWHHERIDFELIKRSKISEIRRISALKKHHANAGAFAPANAHTTTTTYKKVSKEDTFLPELAIEFTEFWQRWRPFEMSKGNKTEAMKAYSKARKEIDHATLIRTGEQYSRNCETIACKTKHVSSWLNGRGWESDDATGEITNFGTGRSANGIANRKPTAFDIAMADRTHR